ncbi:MAG TPA: hypothetical protein VLA33_11780 [Gemmatimonadota bacterium]|nr:hypothetical protein [Gemmatimonadota bacterium]
MKPPIRGMHEMTSIGRLLDPGYPTNRAVLVLLPLAGVVAGGVAAAGGAGIVGVLGRAAGGALAAFGSWALAREIAPDDEIAGAFGALALGFIAYLVFEAALVPVFVALLFARIVARTTGLAATGLDSLLVTAVALFAAWWAGSPWPAAAGAAAFVLDAVLAPGLARQWLFAGLCAAGAVALTSAGLAPAVVPVQPDLPARTIGTVLIVGTIALIAATRSCEARGDATDDPLSVTRVRAGQLATLLTALAWAAAGTAGIEAGALVWAVLAAATISAAWRGVTRG